MKARAATWSYGWLKKREGALAVKLVAAYLRTLDFAEASEEQAKQVYDRYLNKGEPPANEYKRLQDYLFRGQSRRLASGQGDSGPAA